jgi:hypothetical protein
MYLAKRSIKMTLTKIQIVFHLIEKGATLEELMNATGQSATRIRASICEIRNRGIVISVQSNSKSYGDYLNTTYKRVEA